MEIITAAFATAVAAFCFLAIVSKDIKDGKQPDAGAEATATTAD